MKKLIIYIGLLILLSLSVFALEPNNLCEQTISENETCIMLTPVLNCNDNVTVLNKQTNTTREIEMQIIQLDIYNFNFSDDEGEYQVILCDGSTREIEVKGDNMLINITIVLILLAIGLGFVLVGRIIDNVALYIVGGIWFLAVAPLLASKLLEVSILFEYLSIGFFWLLALVFIYIGVDVARINYRSREHED